MLPANLQEYEYRLSAQGSISDIYLAQRMENLPESYIFKIMKTKHCFKTILRERFYLESSILGSLSHERIPRIIYRGSIQDRPYLIYKYIKGKSLERLLQEKHELLDGIKFTIARQLLEILHYIHTRPEPVVHSDISPHNIIIDDQYKVHLIDFGCAQTINQDHRADTWIGKAQYLSPEQAQGKSWDQSSDLYQAGLVLYELLTNEKYFKTANKFELIKLTSNPPSNDLIKVPKHFRSFIKRLINPDLTLRYQSAEEAISAFPRISR